ncbi:MAG: hypothetical protein ISR58_21585 [Anaerolineales bacterium]|nr:hypothetical protein [Chloroflexota bacterium]MBL6983784.1 hypothetical protein [Anaerolineales bacterium]
MTKAITDQELEHLLNFVGYGELDAEVWFLGMEEAGGGENNIRSRLKFRTIEDCAEAHKILGITKHHSGKKIIQRTWRGMCYIMLRLEGMGVDTESIRNYQADSLGRFQGKSLLCELLPIPKPSINDWQYENLIPQYASRDEYYRTVKPRRVKYLQKMVYDHRPKAVVGYGKKYWEDYQELFPNSKFSKCGQFLVARDTDLVVVLTDHLTARTMNGKLDEVVSIINSRT